MNASSGSDRPIDPPAEAPSVEGWDAVVIHADDDVAVALRPLSGHIRVRRGGEVIAIDLPQPIATGHKLALRAIPTGGEVRKYGEVIGAAKADIRPGEHVHVHNLASRRAKSGPS